METPINADITVLREMVRIAENRRTEEFETVERMNKYNLALIAFCGSFLSLLFTVNVRFVTLSICGFILSLALICSFIAIFPRRIRNGALTIDEDIKLLESGKTLHLSQYLLDIAKLTDEASRQVALLVSKKKIWTIFSAALLAIAIISAYIITICQGLKVL